MVEEVGAELHGVALQGFKGVQSFTETTNVIPNI